MLLCGAYSDSVKTTSVLIILHIPLNQDGGSVHVVTRKVDLDQTSMAHMHTERHKWDQTHFSVANFCLDDSDDSCDPE